MFSVLFLISVVLLIIIVSERTTILDLDIPYKDNWTIEYVIREVSEKSGKTYKIYWNHCIFLRKMGIFSYRTADEITCTETGYNTIKNSFSTYEEAESFIKRDRAIFRYVINKETKKAKKCQ